MSVDGYIESLEKRIYELEEVVALQNELVLELNKTVVHLVERGSATPEGIPVTNGEDGGAAVTES